VNQPDEYGRTPLHFAAFVGDLEICKLLIRKGAETGALTKDGKSVTNCAVDGNQSGAPPIFMLHALQLSTACVLPSACNFAAHVSVDTRPDTHARTHT